MKVTYVDHMGSDLSVVNSARVSYNKQSEELTDKDERLINYLATHKHISPFGHCFASFRVKAPVFVARQLVKHKFLRWNEVSRRYVDFEPELHETSVWRSRPINSKQGSGEDIAAQKEAEELQADLHLHAGRVYNRLLELDVAPEQARAMLPQSMMTEWIWSGSLDAFSDMCNLRCKKDTQHETQIIAYEIDRIMRSLYPVSWNALRC